MVKFGRHLQFFLENEHEGSSLYVVPYNDVRDAYIGCGVEVEDDDAGPAPVPTPTTEAPVPVTTSDDEEGRRDRFAAEWRSCLGRASEDFRTAMEALWRRVFDGIAHLPESRGAAPDPALRLFLSSVAGDGGGAGDEAAEELLSQIKTLQSTALTNSEALRKLVKKFDKDAEKRMASHTGVEGQAERASWSMLLSSVLLPELYSANFTVGQPNLEAGAILLRDHLRLDDSSDEDDNDQEVVEASGVNGGQQTSPSKLPPSSTSATTAVASQKSAVAAKATHTAEYDQIAERRRRERRWLRSMAKSIPPKELGHIVSHRGFHSYSDRSDQGRPLENTLSAYEAAWTSGIKLCECDIALTKDERLVLAHDEDFSRLALDRGEPDPEEEHRDDDDLHSLASVKVRDLTYRQLMSLPLRSGARPPLLLEVLRSAATIGNGSQLVVEIKPGNAEAGTALARMFLRHPEAMRCCAVVMSFDAFAMHTLRREMMVVMDQLQAMATETEREEAVGQHHRGHHTRMPSSFGSFPTSMSLGNVAAMASPTSSQDLSNSFSMQVATPAVDVCSPLRGSGTAASVVNTEGGEGGRCGGFVTPKLLLLTVAEPPDIPCKLWLDITKDMSPLDGWLRGNDGSLDGVYLQFQDEMLDADGGAALRELSKRYAVGVWGQYGRDPDDWETFHWLVKECGVSYVNSGLPRDFFKEREKAKLGKTKGTSSKSTI